MRIFAVILIILIQITRAPTGAVSLGRLNELTRQQLLDLDREVSKYYEESYSELDQSSASPGVYDLQLFRSIKALRHTIVSNHFDFRYTQNETKWLSMGEKVNRDLCRYQLELLFKIANKTNDKLERVPLSISNFLDSSGSAGSSVLNGNFVWLGSYSSCVRASVPARIWRRYLANEIDFNDELQHRREHQVAINGRYCVAHLRSKSWPKWDAHFEDRITIKRGICLPESCHSALIDQEESVNHLTDFLARFNLIQPFSGDRYETDNVYCLPDEDSPFREMDLGAKLFVIFVVFWILLTIYTNVVYCRRTKGPTFKCEITVSGTASNSGAGDEDVKSKEHKSLTEDTQAATRGQSHPGLAPSSEATVARSSEIDESDSDTVDRPVKSRKYRTKQRQIENSLDFIRAFSIEANLNFLFRPRLREFKKSTFASGGTDLGSDALASRGSQQLASVAKRSSSSNEALIKDLNLQRGLNKTGRVSIVSSGWKQDSIKQEEQKTHHDHSRVDVDVLDGLKVIATSWIVTGHTMMFFFGFVTDLRFGTDRMLDITMTSTINTLQVVGLFYIITGCLLTYFAFSRTQKKQLLKPLFWLLVLIGRYVRLIPPYALVFWFARHVAPHTGYGHGWLDYRTDEEHARGACAHESWWVMWTMSAADIKIPLGCVPQAWYLSDDFRTLLVLPFYVLLLAKSPLLGYSAIFTTFVYSSHKLVQILREADIDYKILLKWHPHAYAIMADRLHDVYTDSAVRMSTYLLGISVGHLLYLYETGRIKQWPGWFRRWGMKVTLLLGLSFFFGAQLLASPLINQFLPHRDQIDSDMVVLLIPLFKSAMELAICVMILLLTTGTGGYQFIRRILSSQAMKILSNISYIVFLTHVEIMYKLPAQLFESNWWQLFVHAAFFIVTSNVIAFFMHLLFEIPVHNVTRHLFKRVLRLVS